MMRGQEGQKAKHKLVRVSPRLSTPITQQLEHHFQQQLLDFILNKTPLIEKMYLIARK